MKSGIGINPTKRSAKAKLINKKWGRFRSLLLKSILIWIEHFQRWLERTTAQSTNSRRGSNYWSPFGENCKRNKNVKAQFPSLPSGRGSFPRKFRQLPVTDHRNISTGYQTKWTAFLFFVSLFLLFCFVFFSTRTPLSLFRLYFWYLAQAWKAARL